MQNVLENHMCTARCPTWGVARPANLQLGRTLRTIWLTFDFGFDAPGLEEYYLDGSRTISTHQMRSVFAKKNRIVTRRDRNLVILTSGGTQLFDHMAPPIESNMRDNIGKTTLDQTTT